MQKSLTELTALPHEDLIQFVDRIGGPLLVTQDDEPRLVVQPLANFEAMVRRLRFLEAEKKLRGSVCSSTKQRLDRGGAKIIPFRRD